MLGLAREVLLQTWVGPQAEEAMQETWVRAGSVGPVPEGGTGHPWQACGHVYEGLGLRAAFSP